MIMKTGLFSKLTSAIRSIPFIANYLKNMEAIYSARFNADVPPKYPAVTTTESVLWEKNTLHIDSLADGDIYSNSTTDFEIAENQDK